MTAPTEEGTVELPLFTPQEELALAKQSPEGCYLSPAAQALYEEEGRARFLATHRNWSKA